MSELVVFAGPTLGADEIRSRLGPGGEVRPPAAQGDVAAVVAAPSRRPRVVAIVDGVYERVPAVWHKEILWALDLGVAVLGAASMGALRAAELAPYGMAGIGEVYDAVCRGDLVDDDEVAVSHLGAEDGFRALTEAMVNVRATMAAATAAGVVGAAEAATVVAAGKQLHYPRRRWPEILAASGLPPERTAALRAWLPDGRRDVKAADAWLLLGLAADLLAGRASVPRPEFRFERTEQWRLVEPAATAAALDVGLLADLLDGLRLDGCYQDLERAATLRLVAATAAHRDGTAPAGDALGQWAARVRERVPPDDLADLDPDGLHRLAGAQAALVRACTDVEDRIPQAITETLRIRGEYAGRLRQARTVRDRCAELGWPDDAPDPAALGLTDAAVRRWCAERAGLPAAKEPPDLDDLAAAYGLDDPAELRRAALRYLAAFGPAIP
jgi:hypothetical protein